MRVKIQSNLPKLTRITFKAGGSRGDRLAEQNPGLCDRALNLMRVKILNSTAKLTRISSAKARSPRMSLELN